MSRLRWLGIAILLVFVLTSCAGPKTDRASRPDTATSRPTSAPTSTTTRTIPPFQPSEVAHLGGTLAFTAAYQLTTGIQTAAVRITLDNVIDPAPDGPGSLDPSPGHRNVELRVTLQNIGDDTVPVLGEGDEGVLSIEWALDPDIVNGDGVPIYQAEYLPSPSCQNETMAFPNPGLVPGRSLTGCIVFDISDGTSVHSATALLLYPGGSNGGAPGEWLIP